LALLEVSGHVLCGDRDPVELRADFTDRLMACVDRPRTAWLARVRLGLYVGGPLAAAAVIALAFLGAFDGQRHTRRAGVAVEARDVDLPGLFDADGQTTEAGYPTDPPPGADEWAERLQQNVDIKRESGASLQRAIELQLQNLLDAAERGTDQLQKAGPAPDPAAARQNERGAAPSQSDKTP
jgi:hypothetical protein